MSKLDAYRDNTHGLTVKEKVGNFQRYRRQGIKDIYDDIFLSQMSEQVHTNGDYRLFCN